MGGGASKKKNVPVTVEPVKTPAKPANGKYFWWEAPLPDTVVTRKEVRMMSKEEQLRIAAACAMA
jgi:hypothetical protein